ncbi:MAG: hypothetical protein D4S01_02540 [Dehalococcoidia bacterium]|nr:MAG: hypothetical protein D4S01_02540 [Dehalococcoidia bacterium]
MTNFHNLTNDERDRLNLPPVGFQGEEFTTIIQAPTSKALQKRVDQFRLFAQHENYETFEVLQHGRDPDGGYKAILTAHNWNPITWTAEKGYRAYLGIKHAPAIGRAKALAKHQVGAEAEVLRAAEEEEARVKRKLAVSRAVEAEKAKREPEQAAARQRMLYSTSERPPKDIFADLNESIFGKGVKL